MMEFAVTILCGVVIGIAEIIPGVSGGTLAVLLNIYDKLIGSISRLTKNLKKNLLFLAPLVLGMGIGIFAFSFVISFLLEHFPMAVNFFFLGLVIGIIPMLLRRALETPFKGVSLVGFVAMFGVMVLLAVVSSQSGASTGAIEQLDLLLAVRLCLVGVLAAVCMILPGISGSMIMVIFGTYETVVNAVKNLNILVLLPVGIGVLAGLLFGAKLVDFCLRRFPQFTYFAILGLVGGSAIPIFMKAVFTLSVAEGWVALLMLAAGVLVSLFFTSERMQNKGSKQELKEENAD